VRTTRGLFQVADSGTLLLDEISETSAAFQAKLLRALQEREVRRVGSAAALAVDARIVATTNQDLGAEVRAGRFRADLYHRLNVVRVRVPPLRQRPADISALTDFLLRRKAAEHEFPLPVVEPAARAALERHPWPGNVRELENVLERALLLSRQGMVTADDLQLEPVGTVGTAPTAGTTIKDAERALVLETLRTTRGNRTRAAKLLGISVRTLRNKLHEYRASGHLREDDP
jgi:DNA-binding NtrC family response regulator